MNPTAVVFAIILSIAAVSRARLDPSTAVKLRGPQDLSVRWDSVFVPADDPDISRQIAHSLRLPSGRRVSRVRCHGGRHVSSRTVRLPPSVSRDEFRMRVQRLAYGEVGAGRFPVEKEGHGFGPENRKRGHRKEMGGGFMGLVRKFMNRF